ncbi:hypothetical protein Leryth_001683 [Lithospermum erythrorhizon]|nr:hypothetical protein Leryth_001683 [Lithospermum erythrorhizon]
MADDVDLLETLKKTQIKAKLVHMGSLPFTELVNLRTYILNKQSEVSWNVMVDMVAALQFASGSIKRQWLLDVLQISCVTKHPSTALQFAALLCGSCCKYMPILVVNKSTVMSDLPVTLPTLLQNTSWMEIADSVVLYLWTSTERIYHWKTGTVDPDEQTIDAKERNVLDFLLRVMHRTCVILKDYLSPDKRLNLANMVLS